MFAYQNHAKNTESATKRVVQQRSRNISHVCNVVAGKDIESVRKQQGSELKQKTTEEREIICNEAGLKHSVHVSDDYTLAIKSSV